MSEDQSRDDGRSEHQLTDMNKLAEAVAQKIATDWNFRWGLIKDLLKFYLNLTGFATAVLIALVFFFGYKSLGDIAEDAMITYLSERGEEFEREFQRLSSIPSYATRTLEITVNDSANNFVPFPYFDDIGRYATEKECHWFIALTTMIGDSIVVVDQVDAVESVAGLRFIAVSASDRSTTGARHSFPRKDISTKLMAARVFIFAQRKIE